MFFVCSFFLAFDGSRYVEDDSARNVEVVAWADLMLSKALVNENC
jgi:hypothetical protein